MLLRLGYLTVSNVFAVLRLLPMGDRDKDDVEILALRHQIAVLERQLGACDLRERRHNAAGGLAPAVRPGPYPVVVLLHGFPGYERNFDLAQGLRRAGYAALVFHYCGSWGMGGSWSWAHVLEDAAGVVARLPAPEAVAARSLDPGRLAVIGHSLGGFTALMTAAADPGVAAVGSVAGFDFGTAAGRGDGCGVVG